MWQNGGDRSDSLGGWRGCSLRWLVWFRGSDSVDRRWNRGGIFFLSSIFVLVFWFCLVMVVLYGDFYGVIVVRLIAMMMMMLL
jgi:hypothetical protein